MSRPHTATSPITVEEITDRWTNRTMNYADCGSDEKWEELFLEPVERFGLTYCLRDLAADTVPHEGSRSGASSGHRSRRRSRSRWTGSPAAPSLVS